MDPQTFDLTDFDEYVRKNPFMDYNHIRIVEISRDKSRVQMVRYMVAFSILWQIVLQELPQEQMDAIM